jgi:type III secretion system HrpE/YscL family protein
MSGGRVIPAERVRALSAADDILDEARAEAAKLLGAARLEAEALTEEARREGREAAWSEANALLLAARSERARMLDGMQRDVVRLALDVARKVIGREVESSPQLLLETCSQSLKRLVAARSLVIKVNPTEVELVQRHLGILSPHLSLGAEVEVEADEAIAIGGCLVESELGLVDTRLETQLAAIERALMEGEDG